MKRRYAIALLSMVTAMVFDTSASILDTSLIRSLFTYDSTVLAGTQEGDIFKYDWRTKQWEEYSNGLSTTKYVSVNSFTIYRDTVYAATVRGVYSSPKGSLGIWSACTSGFSPYPPGSGIAIVTFADRLFFSTTGYVYVLTDSTRTWLPLHEGLPAGVGMGAFMGLGNTFYMLYGGRICHSIDTGKSWQWSDGVYSTKNHDNYYFYRLTLPTCLAASNNIGYLVDFDGIVYKTQDLGLSWQIVLRTSWSPSSTTLASCIFADDRCVILGYTKKWQDTVLLLSTNEGTNWINITMPPNVTYVTAITRLGEMIVVGTTRGLFYSDDWGVTWKQFGSPSRVSKPAWANNTRAAHSTLPAKNYDLRGRYHIAPLSGQVRFDHNRTVQKRSRF